VKARWGTGATALVMALVAAGCSSSSSSTATASKSAHAVAASISTTPSGPAATAEAKATTAYLAMWADYVNAAATDDYQSPLLAERASGDALSELVHGLYEAKLNVVVTKGPAPTHHVTVSALYPASDPTEVRLVDCSSDATWRSYNVATGKPASGTPGGRHHIEAVVTETGGVWKVTELAVRGVGTC
jgi:hypothetical protein